LSNVRQKAMITPASMAVASGGPVVPGPPISTLFPPFHVWPPELPRSCRIPMRRCR